MIIGAVGAIFVWWLRLGVPESPRWLPATAASPKPRRSSPHIEAQVQAEQGCAAAGRASPDAAEEGDGGFGEIWQPPYGGRAVMLSVFNFFQTFGYYGFAAWVPTLLIAKGINITTSLQYAFIIAIANPIGPLLCAAFADRMERKWQICCAAIGIGVFGMLFARQADPGLLILFGVLVTLCNNWLSYAFHGYQAELFPTRIRSRAIGFVYSWSRLSAAFSGLAVGFFLTIGGVDGGVQLHRGGDGHRGGVDRHLRPAHPQPGAGGNLARVSATGVRSPPCPCWCGSGGGVAARRLTAIRRDRAAGYAPGKSRG